MAGKVLTGLSGGVDSSVAAALLVRDGYEVIGVTLKLYDYDGLDYDPPDGGCCSLDLVEDARAACHKLGIPHYVIDMRSAFRSDVIEDFIKTYDSGRTPNPCIRCNTHIKWGEMLKTAIKLECDFVATGHYARIDRSVNPPGLLKGIDENRDQSYALWGITPEALPRTLFPLGEITKDETRRIAADLNLRNANRPDSQEICFVPDNDYAALIRRNLGDEAASLKPGPVFDTAGKEIGRHKGIANYTVGQRRGLGISAESPLYVAAIDVSGGSITVGRREDLLASRFTAKDLNMLVELSDIPEKIEAKIRYRHKPAAATLIIDGDKAKIVFDAPQMAITPGQSAVFYDGDRALGGGIIDRVQR
jgi:tRNA-specific 2-thiouridylase